MAIQPFTYDTIKTGGWLNGTSLALPHGLGHGWASMLWDMDSDLIDKYGFNRDLYARLERRRQQPRVPVRGRRHEDAGLDPGLVADRDGDPAAAADPRRRRRHVHGWATFAAAASASAPSREPTDRNDSTEAFDTHPTCLRRFQREGVDRRSTSGYELDHRCRFGHADDGYRGLT